MPSYTTESLLIKNAPASPVSVLPNKQITHRKTPIQSHLLSNMADQTRKRKIKQAHVYVESFYDTDSLEFPRTIVVVNTAYTRTKRLHYL